MFEDERRKLDAALSEHSPANQYVYLHRLAVALDISMPPLTRHVAKGALIGVRIEALKERVLKEAFRNERTLRTFQEFHV